MTKFETAIEIGKNIQERLENLKEDFSTAKIVYKYGCTFIQFTNGNIYKLSIKKVKQFKR